MTHSAHAPRRRIVGIGLALALAASLIPLASVAAANTLTWNTYPPNPAMTGVSFPVSVHTDNATPLTITLDIRPNHNPGGASFTCTSGTALVSDGSGNANFTGCVIDNPGSGYELRARASGAIAIFTPDFDVESAGATHLQFTQVPAATTPSLLSPQPQVKVLDGSDNVVTTDNTTVVTLSIASGTPTSGGPGTLTCTGGLSKTVTNGVANFAGCTIDTSGVGYKLHAVSVPNLTADNTPAFTVTSGVGTKLQYCWGTATACQTTPPGTITGGTPLSLQPEVRILDVNDNLVVGDSTTVVTLGLTGGTGSGALLTCTGGLSKTVTNGKADFTGCAIDKAGTAFRINVTSSPVLTSTQSNTFNVTAGAPAKLGFLTQPPASVTAGTAMGTIQVAIEDAGGNVITTGITATILLAIGTNPSGGTLTCTGGNSATTVAGVATFTGCSINNQGVGYTLTATSTSSAPLTSLAGATSSAITVLAPNASITVQAPSVITWGDRMTISVHFGTNGANKTFNLQVSKDGTTFSNIGGATLTTNSNGDASFVYGPSDNRYYRASFAGTGDLQAGVSNVVRTVVRQINLLRPAPADGYRNIHSGTSIVFTSTIRPNRPELPQATAHFVVYQFTNGEWTQVLDRMVGVDRATGKASLQVTFNTAGKFYVRSQAVPTPFNANSGWSPLDLYRVG